MHRSAHQLKNPPDIMGAHSELTPGGDGNEKNLKPVPDEPYRVVVPDTVTVTVRTGTHSKQFSRDRVRSAPAPSHALRYEIYIQLYTVPSSLQYAFHLHTPHNTSLNVLWTLQPTRDTFIASDGTNTLRTTIHWNHPTPSLAAHSSKITSTPQIKHQIPSSASLCTDKYRTYLRGKISKTTLYSALLSYSTHWTGKPLSNRQVPHIPRWKEALQLH